MRSIAQSPRWQQHADRMSSGLVKQRASPSENHKWYSPEECIHLNLALLFFIYVNSELKTFCWEFICYTPVSGLCRRRFAIVIVVTECLHCRYTAAFLHDSVSLRISARQALRASPGPNYFIFVPKLASNQDISHWIWGNGAKWTNLWLVCKSSIDF